MMKSTEPVEVYCRLRPMDETDLACVQEISDTVVEFTPPPNLKSAASITPKVTQATFTGIFSAESCQDGVFNRTAYEFVSDDLISGKNGLLFTYGATGSGKTHTMLGNPQNPGILPRCLDTIFNSVSRHQAKPYTFVCDKMNGFEVQPDDNLAEIQRGRERLKPALPFARKAPTLTSKKDDLDWELSIVADVDDDNAFSVFVSYVQIYNNFVYDLLDVPESTNNPPMLESKILREDRKHNMYVYGAVEVEVKSADEAFNVFINAVCQQGVSLADDEADRGDPLQFNSLTHRPFVDLVFKMAGILSTITSLELTHNLPAFLMPVNFYAWNKQDFAHLLNCTKQLKNLAMPLNLLPDALSLAEAVLAKVEVLELCPFGLFLRNESCQRLLSAVCDTCTSLRRLSYACRCCDNGYCCSADACISDFTVLQQLGALNHLSLDLGRSGIQSTSVQTVSLPSLGSFDLHTLDDLSA